MQSWRDDDEGPSGVWAAAEGPPLQPPTPRSVNCCLATRFILAGLQAAVCCLWTHPGIRHLFAIRARTVLAAVAGVSSHDRLIFTKTKPRKHLSIFWSNFNRFFHPLTVAATSGHSPNSLGRTFQVFPPREVFPPVSAVPSVWCTHFWCHAIIMQERQMKCDSPVCCPHRRHTEPSQMHANVSGTSLNN